MRETSGPDLVAEQRNRIKNTLKRKLRGHENEKIRGFFNQHNDQSINAIFANVAGVIVVANPDNLQTFVAEQIASYTNARDKRIQAVLTGPIDKAVLHRYIAEPAQIYRTLSSEHQQDRTQEVTVARYLVQELQGMFDQPEDIPFRTMQRRAAILLSQLSEAVYGQNYYDRAGQRQVSQNLKARLELLENLTTIAFATARSQFKDIHKEPTVAHPEDPPCLDTTVLHIDRVLFEEGKGIDDSRETTTSGTTVVTRDKLFNDMDALLNE